MRTTTESSSINVTVKLDSSERDRLKLLAVSKKRTPHYLMREAIQVYLATEESNARFVAAAQDSLGQYEKTGKHISLDELRAWTKALKKNPKTPMPACHK